MAVENRCCDGSPARGWVVDMGTPPTNRKTGEEPPVVAYTPIPGVAVIHGKCRGLLAL
jgi:hypothetical protein